MQDKYGVELLPGDYVHAPVASRGGEAFIGRVCASRQPEFRFLTGDGGQDVSAFEPGEALKVAMHGGQLLARLTAEAPAPTVPAAEAPAAAEGDAGDEPDAAQITDDPPADTRRGRRR